MSLTIRSLAMQSMEKYLGHFRFKYGNGLQILQNSLPLSFLRAYMAFTKHLHLIRFAAVYCVFPCKAEPFQILEYRTSPGFPSHGFSSLNDSTQVPSLLQSQNAFHYLRFICVIMRSLLVMLHRSMLLMLFGQIIRLLIFRYLLMNFCSLCVMVFDTNQVSLLYNMH